MVKEVRSVSLLLAAAAFLAGCADMGFKRGGSAADFAAAQQRCRAAGDPGYQACMADAGWTTGAAEAAAPAATSPPAGATVPAVAPSPAAPPASTPSAPAAAAIPVPAPASPGTSVPWWKLGGGAGDLAAAQTACGGKVEPPTPAYLDCMTGQGWRRVVFQAGK